MSEQSRNIHKKEKNTPQRTSAFITSVKNKSPHYKETLLKCNVWQTNYTTPVQSTTYIFLLLITYTTMYD